MPARRGLVNVRAVSSSTAPADPAGLSARSDGELLCAHIGGDRYAFEELFRRHRGRLYRLARRSSATPEDAHDAVQDAMLSAHRYAGSFRHDAAVSSWLSRIVLNACRDRLRYNALRPTVGLVVDVPAPDRTGQLETALVVRQALSRLPAGQRAAVLAVDMHGYSVAEAAALLEVAEGTVKSRCARARTRLAVLLNGCAA